MAKEKSETSKLESVPCPECDGKDESCTRCSGTGQVAKMWVDPEEYKREKAGK